MCYVQIIKIQYFQDNKYLSTSTYHYLLGVGLVDLQQVVQSPDHPLLVVINNLPLSPVPVPVLRFSVEHSGIHPDH